MASSLRRSVIGRHPLVFMGLSVYAVFNILTLVWLVSTSLKTSSEILGTSPWLPPSEPAFSNYFQAWSIGKIGLYLFNSLFVTSVTIVCLLLLGSMVGYVFARVRLTTVTIVRMVFLAAMMMPPFAVVVPLFDILSAVSLLNSRLGLILVYIAMQLPITAFILASFHSTLAVELEEAAAIDGASAWHIFFSVVLPQTRPALGAVAVVNVLQVWNEFIYALTFISTQSSYTLPVGIFKLSQLADYSSNWSILFAGMVFSIVPIVVVFALFQRTFVGGLSEGAVKL